MYRIYYVECSKGQNIDNYIKISRGDVRYLESDTVEDLNKYIERVINQSAEESAKDFVAYNDVAESFLKDPSKVLSSSRSHYDFIEFISPIVFIDDNNGEDNIEEDYHTKLYRTKLIEILTEKFKIKHEHDVQVAKKYQELEKTRRYQQYLQMKKEFE